MSASASQAAAFYKEVAKTKVVWTVRDNGGFPAPKGRDGTRAQPFWSSASRAKIIIKKVHAYSGFSLVEISWTDFATKWVPQLRKDGFKVGVNWSGAHATGYDLEPDQVKRAVETLFDPDHPWWRRILK